MVSSVAYTKENIEAEAEADKLTPSDFARLFRAEMMQETQKSWLCVFAFMYACICFI